MNITIKYPESLDDITLKQYNKIKAMGDNATPKGIVEELCIIDGDIDLIPDDVIEQYALRCMEAISSQGDKECSNFTIGDIEFTFQSNANTLSYGANSDCITYFSDWSNANKAMAVLYRPMKDGKIVEYNGTSEYADIMMHTPMSKVLVAQKMYMEFNNSLKDYYPSLFSPSSKGDDDFSIEANFGRRWSSYSEMLTLAGGDPIRIDEAVKMNVHAAYTFLAYTVDKNKMENARIKQNLNK